MTSSPEGTVSLEEMRKRMLREFARPIDEHLVRTGFLKELPEQYKTLDEEDGK